MKALTLKQVTEAVKGRLNKKEYESIIISDVSTDSRSMPEKSLFVPLVGERFDGHDYITAALETGAVCTLSAMPADIEREAPVILVEDTLAALGRLATYYRGLFDLRVVAVTGSSGKTTTKDIIASVLAQKFRVLKSEGNFNNEIGLPLTIFNIDEQTEVAVLEMGMNNFGEIDRLSAIAHPDYAVITNIGSAHIEKLGSREGILKAKSEIFNHMNTDGIAILNGDDDMLQTLIGKLPHVCFFGTDMACSFYSTQVKNDGLRGVSFTINGLESSYEVYVPQSGYHMVLNALAAAAVGELMGLSEEQIRRGLAEYSPSAMRMNIIEANGLTIIDDAYNANPSSMRAALDVLKSVEGRTVCILGDMLELGEHSAELHYELGLYAAESEIDVIVCIGEESRRTFDGASKVIKETKSESFATYFADKQGLLHYLEENKLLEPGDTILVKASRGIQFEEITKELMR